MKLDNEAIQADWSRERCSRLWDPSRRFLRAIRGYQHWHQRGDLIGRLVCAYFTLWYRFWGVVTGADIPLNSSLGGGLLLPHPNGIVIHPEAVIGPNCLLFQQVTIGTRGQSRATPRLGAWVEVGAGAKILGGVVLGAGARIGANAVVLTDVPPGAVAVGVPAVVVQGKAKAVVSCEESEPY